MHRPTLSSRTHMSLRSSRLCTRRSSCLRPPPTSLIVPFPTTEEPTSLTRCMEAQLVALLSLASSWICSGLLPAQYLVASGRQQPPLTTSDPCKRLTCRTPTSSSRALPRTVLASQPLVLFRVTWIRQTSHFASSHASKPELLAFSIPQSLATKFDPGNVRSDLESRSRAVCTSIGLKLHIIPVCKAVYVRKHLFRDQHCHTAPVAL